MPASVIVAGISGLMAGSTIIGGLTIGFSWTAFASSLVMSGLSAALRPDVPDQQQGGGSITSGARTVTIRQPIMPWRVIYGRARVGGGVTYKKVTGTHNVYHLVLTLAGHTCEEIEAVYFGEDEVPLDGAGEAIGKYAGYVRIQKSLGDEVGQPFPDLVTETDNEWTDAHRQTGHTKIYVRIYASNDLFPSGLPNISAIVKGRNDIYDPRDDSIGYSANPALCVNNYLTDATRGIGAIYAGEINEAELVAAASACDETVTLADGTTEPRFTCNGTFILSEKPVDLIPKIASAMAGYVVKIGSTWRIHAGVYDTPTLELTETDLAGAISWQSLVSRRDSCNGVKGIYIEPANLWQPGDFPAVVSDAAVADDNGEQVWHDLRLEFTDSGTMAQRIAKIDLLRTRQPLTVSFPGKLSAFRAQPGKTVLLTVAKYGWSSKPFWIADGTFAVNADGTLGYHLSLRETAPEIYDWNTDEESPVDFAPNTDMGDPLTIAAPGVPDVTETLYETTGSAGVKARATMSWSASVDGFLLDYLPEYRVSGGTWVALSSTTDTSVPINDIEPGIYEFRLRQRNVMGVRSEYGGTRVKEIFGLTAAPADVTGFSVIKSAGFALCAWTLHPDLDVRQGGSIVVRHSPLTTGAAWENGIIIESFSGNAINGNLALMTGTYMAKALDSSRNYSAAEASVVVTEGMVSGFTTVGSVTFSPTFAGSMTNVGVLDSALRLVSAEMIDGSDDIDAADDIDGGTIAASGYCDLTSVLDMTTVAVRRVQVSITAQSFDVSDYIDGDDDFDSAEDIDGAVINDCDATIYCATTPDDPTGSPVWSAWQPFFVADFEARAMRFRIALESGLPSHTIAVSALSVAAKVPV